MIPCFPVVGMNQKDKTVDHGGTETQRKAKEAKTFSGFPAFDFLCAFVS
jgi:hypothetical protein